MAETKTKPDPAQIRLGKAQSLFDARKDLITKLAAIDAEIEAVLSGGKTIGQRMKRLRDQFGERWQALHRRPYAWVSAHAGQESDLLKKILNQLTDEEASERLAKYFADDDDYLRKERYPLRLFAWRINKYVENDGLEFDDDSSAPADCMHKPKCKTDAEHTDKKMREYRA